MSRSIFSVNAPAWTARMPITQVPTSLAREINLRGSAFSVYVCIEPGESNKFVMHCMALGAGLSFNVSAKALGIPIPLIPQLLIFPLCTRFSKAGLTS